MPTCWQNRNALPDTPANRVALIKDYIACIMRVDELRQAALGFAYEHYGVDPATMSGPQRVDALLKKAAEINTDTVLLDYLKDVEYLIFFEQPSAKTAGLLKDTKEDRLRSEPLLNMIYPWRLSNLQIKLLAENFQYLKATPTDLDRLKALKSDATAYTTALQITAGHLMSEAYELSYKLTGNAPMDGLYMYMSLSDYQKTFREFYATFLDTVVGAADPFDADKCKDLFGIKGATTMQSCARAAAGIFLLYKKLAKWSHTTLLQQFQDPAGVNCAAQTDTEIPRIIAENEYHLPTRNVWDAPIAEGLTFAKLLNQLDPDIMQFVLQLAYRLEYPDAGAPTKKQGSAA